MNFAHLHLLLNHFPIIGTIIALSLLLVSFGGEGSDLRRSGLIIFAASALLAIPAFLSGFGARIMLSRDPGVPTALLERHEAAAMLSLWFMETTGALALVALWRSHRTSRPARWHAPVVLLFALLTVGLMTRTGDTGGDIRHPEVRASQQAIVMEGTLASIVHAFEPTPEKFSQAVVGSLWVWGLLMFLHFVGLTLIVGTIGVFDIRIMGFIKQLPLSPLYGFIPWAMAGLGVNIVTGLLAFIGSPDRYVTSSAFWLKMLSLLLLGLNAVAFYLTGISERVEHLESGEDAPMPAKLIAGSALLLWLAMIVFGRYIAPLSDTLPPSAY
jgi:uncharacterized membrane protein